MARIGGRPDNELRPLTLTTHYLDFAEGSVLVTWGRTRVLCAASVQEEVPPFRRGLGAGWVRGRAHEIQRLIGRSLRAVVDLKALGERPGVLDCDVLQADGGTRSAAITGAFVALCLALEPLRRQEIIEAMPVRNQVAAVSVGLVGERLLLDLDYQEDSTAQVDMNVVMTGRGLMVEIQGTGEERPFSREELDGLLGLAGSGIGTLVEMEKRIVGDIPAREIYQAGHFLEE